jgi:Cu/Ag efflux protein CusF
MWIALILIALIATATACGDSSTGTASVEGQPAPDPDVYRVRGEVTEMPVDAGDMMYIRHEAIPDFKGASGPVQGMDSMIMGFRPAEGVSLDGVEVGTKIAFVLEITWGSEPRQEIRDVEILPPETELDVAY